MLPGGTELMHDGSDLTSEENREKLWEMFDKGFKEEVRIINRDEVPFRHDLDDDYNQTHIMYWNRGVGPFTNNPKAK